MAQPSQPLHLEIEVNVRAPAKAQSKFKRFMGTDPARLQQRVAEWIGESVSDLAKATPDQSVEVVE